MSPAELKDALTLATPLVGLAGAVLGIFKYFNYRSHKDRMDAVGTRFTAVVDGLGSKDEVKRRAAAITLRRFFDPGSEFGVAGTPYATEAVNVIAAVLREERTGSFQKLLADGLWYAHDLSRADLQKTNLQNAFLGTRKVADGDGVKDVRLRLDGADFFRADLSGASLKGAHAKGAVFYQARLARTVFRDAVLDGANFADADLQDAKFAGADLRDADFSGANLRGASFAKALHVPPAVAAGLNDQGVWAGAPGGGRPRRVFLSRPAQMRAAGVAAVEQLRLQLARLGPVEFVELPRSDYPSFGALAEVRKHVTRCHGLVVLGLGELEIADATWRAGTPDERRLQGAQWPSPWAQIEAGMGIALGLPVLLVAAPSLDTGIFAPDLDGHRLYRVGGVAEMATPAAAQTLQDWFAAVGEQAAA